MTDEAALKGAVKPGACRRSEKVALGRLQIFQQAVSSLALYICIEKLQKAFLIVHLYVPLSLEIIPLLKNRSTPYGTNLRYRAPVTFLCIYTSVASEHPAKGSLSEYRPFESKVCLMPTAVPCARLSEYENL